MGEDQRLADEEVANFRQRRQDLADYYNETAGLDTGRVRRFIPVTLAPDSNEERKKERDAFLDALAEQASESLRQLAYDAAYESYERASQADGAAHDAIADRLDRIGLIEQELEERRLEILRNAQRLEDGSLVVWDSEGRARYPDGSLVPDEMLVGVERDPDAARWEQLEELDRIAERLVEIKARVQDQEARVAAVEAEIEADRIRIG